MVSEVVSRLYREESGRILATLIRLLGDFDLAEEVVHEAFAAALEQWPGEGTPANPRAWVTQAARHKAIDRLRRQSRFAEKLQELERLAPLDASGEHEGESPVPDDRLRLIFTCCHPALGQALALASNEPERHFLRRRLAEAERHAAGAV